MSGALTARDIAAMKARPAAIRAENDAYTQGRLRAGRQVCGMEIERARLYREDGTLVAMAFTTLEAGSEADARRLAACWNACAGVPTETLELCARWGDVVNAAVFSRVHIPAEAAAVGVELDPKSIEQGDIA